jgi:diguanylate cyclase (GGDEF)-like protein
MSRINPPRYRILLVDDDSDSIIIMRHVLDDDRYDIEWCANADSARQVLAEQEFDICLLDYRLGSVDGLEFLADLRGEGFDTPIILYTGQQDIEVEREAARLGADDYLAKDDLSAAILDRMVFFAIERRKAHSELIRMALTDALTGAANRTALQEFITGARRRAQRHDRQFALLLLDLDGFKTINDEHGHAVGDAVLVNLVRIVKRCTRESDLVARIGGDEFVIVLDDIVNREGALKSAENIRRRLAEGFSLQGGRFAIRASIGVSIWPADGDAMPDLLAVADSSMYRQKRSTRARDVLTAKA